MAQPKRPSPAAMAKAVAAFNQRHAVGDVILCWPGLREGKPVPRTILSPANILSGHTAVVYVAGGGGCIALTHVADPTQMDDLATEAAAQLAVEGVPA
jgi:hypothetical protein